MVEVLCKWEWKERTKTFLLRIQFLPLRPSPNFRWTMKERGVSGKATFGVTFSEGRSWEVPLIDWVPSWLEYGRIGELMRFTDYLNSLKMDKKLQFREMIGDKWVNSRRVTEKSWWELARGQY